MTYTLLPEIIRGIILIFTTVILIIYMAAIIRMLIMGMRNPMLAVTVAAALLGFILYQFMSNYQESDIDSFDFPVIALVMILVLLFVFSIYAFVYISGWKQKNISRLSVNEAFDRIPTGLCYYMADGTPIMVNESMQEISRKLTGRSIVNAKDFVGKVPDLVHNEEKIYSIRQNTLDIDGHEVYELTAADISREYGLSCKLELQYNRAKVLNSRLKALMGTIEYVTMNRELFQLKRSLHDNIGQSILIAKRYLTVPDSVDKKEMINFWRDNINHLVNDQPEEWELPYYVISKEADRLGIRLDIRGVLPEETELIPVVDAAISTELGNTLKHADGTVVTITVTEEDNRYILKMTNDGRPPESEITERGGLTNLRNIVEEAGGSMEITSLPRFIMTVILPGKGEESIYGL